MKKKWIFSSFVILISFFLFSSCETTPVGESVDLTFLHTNDLHLHLETNSDTSAENPFGLGGFSRLQTLIHQKRTENPNSLLLDAGDWSEGNIFYSADAGVGMLKIMNLMGYNAAALGNHDFLINPMNLTEVIEKADVSFPILGANKNVNATSNPARVEKAVKPYSIFDINGVRVAVIGLLTEDFFYYEFFKPAIVTNSFEAAAKISKELKEKQLADVIVLLSHNDFNMNVKLARTVPWVNAVISGHSHFKTPRAIEVSNAGQPVYVAETGQWGQFLGQMTLTYNRSSKQTRLKHFELLPVEKTIPEDKEIGLVISDLKNTLQKKWGNGVFEESLGHCDHEMVRSDSKEVPLANLAADSYRAEVGADFALESVQLIGMGLNEGKITPSQAFNIQPHVYFPTTEKTWTVKTLRLSGIQVRELLNLTFLANSIGLNLGWISLSGGKIIYKGEKSISGINPNPVTSIFKKDFHTGAYLPIESEKKYSIALHDGILMTLQILNSKLGLGIDLSGVEDSGVQAWQSISKFIDQTKIIQPENFKSGERYQPEGFDLAIAEHGVRVTEKESSYEFHVIVANEGLKSSPPGYSFAAFKSEVNDKIYDGTAAQVFSKIGESILIPSLRAGEKIDLSFALPSDQISDSGIYSFKIVLNAIDENSRNNSLFMHFALEKKGAQK